MTDRPRWLSPRQALGYMYAHHSGPKLARQDLSGAPRSTNRTPWDASEIAALVRGPRKRGLLGIEQDSELDLELRAWATTKGYPRSKRVRNIEIRLRRLMRQYGMKQERRALRAMVRHVFTDAYTGDEVSTLVPKD